MKFLIFFSLFGPKYPSVGGGQDQDSYAWMLHLLIWLGRYLPSIYFELDSSLKLCLYHLQLPINLTTISFYTLLLFRRALLIVLVAHMILSPTRRSAMKLQIGVTLFSHVTNIWRQEELHKTMNGGVTNHHTKNFLDTSSRVWFKKK